MNKLIGKTGTPECKKFDYKLQKELRNHGDIESTDEEWQEVQEGLADYKKGNVISFNEFLNKR